MTFSVFLSVGLTHQFPFFGKTTPMFMTFKYCTPL